MTEMTLQDILKEPTRKKFVQTILETNEIEFKLLYTNYLKISETNARHHLKQLEDNQIVTRSKKAGSKSIFLHLNPKFLEEARGFFDIPRIYAYLGFVGLKGAQQVTDIISTLISNQWTFKKLIVYTTQQTFDTMKEDILWKQLLEKFTDSELLAIERSDYNAIHETLREKIEDLLVDYSLVTDVTGLTKLHSLALYSLARVYGLKRVYIPEDDSQSVLTLP
ncbi:MAG: hypothetical protein ACFE96_08700 [Candidatus Hermodarchaeota archaeon]